MALPHPPFIQYLEDLDLTINHLVFIFDVDMFVSPILAWIPSVLQEYTDHGKLHSENVLKNVRDLVAGYTLEINEEEKFLLAL